MELSFTIQGRPKSLQRHRDVRQKGKIRTYDPSAKDKQNFLYMAKYYCRPTRKLKGPITLEVKFYFNFMKKHYGTGNRANILKHTAPNLHTEVPDLDNLIKFVKDALNKVYYEDDSLICHILADKYYSENPRTEIILREIE